MDSVTIGYLSLIALMLFLFLGVHVGVSLALIGFVGIWLIQGSFQAGIGVLPVSAFYKVVTYSLSPLPVFILMGYLALESDLGVEIFDTASKWAGRLPGGLAIATVVGNAFFGAICGSSIVATTVFAKIALPEMERYKYNLQLAAGTVTGGSMLGMLIPPSILMVIYGVITEQSVGRLLMAGIGPGILLCLLFVILVLGMALLNPKLVPEAPQSVPFKEKVKSLKGTWAFLIIAILLVIGIYLGFFSPTEAGAVGAIGVFIIGLLRRKLNWPKIKSALADSGLVTASIFLVVIGAMIFSRFLAMSTLPTEITRRVVLAGLSPMLMVCTFMIMYLFLGCILDSSAMMLITLPIIHPLIVGMGLDPIWFAMCVIMAIEIGLLTPPFGLSVFAFKASVGDKMDLMEIFRGAVPFAFVSLIALVMVILFPPISVTIPNSMFGK
jgi:tripartite ATP-independent transporter DctM subunit